MKVSQKVKKQFFDFLEEYKLKHKEIPNTRLIPVNDPSALFISAGMHPLTPYLLGQPHSSGNRLYNVQRCFRTIELDEDSVGDTTHHTMFEMLGYWSLNDYFKAESLDMTFDFFCSGKGLGFDPSRLYVTVFSGDSDAPRDDASIQKWKEIYKRYGIEAGVFDGKTFNENTRIFPLDKTENWWGPVGSAGPCGPDSEVFYWRGEDLPNFDECTPWDSGDMFIEISNNVFMEYDKQKDGTFVKMNRHNVDFGAGFERLVMIRTFMHEDGSVPISFSNYDTDLFSEARDYLRTQYKFSDNKEIIKSERIILDHMRAIVFLIGDEVEPSNKDQGYMLRRLIRRVIRSLKKLDIKYDSMLELSKIYIERYGDGYRQLEERHEEILGIVSQEINKFEKALERGLRNFDNVISNKEKVTGTEIFELYESYGFPFEMTIEELGIDFESEQFEKLKVEFKDASNKHKEQSRTASVGKFKGGLADQSENTTTLHTTQHLLLKAIQIVLGDDVKQKGSNINSERIRLDINFDRALEESEIKEIEGIVNEKIQEDLNVIRVELPKDKAQELGAQMEFGQKYPDIVSVYFITNNEDKKEVPESWFSAEFCGGPHVRNTNEIKGTFEIYKQESIGSGKRRLKARLVH